MSQDNRAVNTVLTDEENAAVALSVARWSWKEAPVALFLSLVISLWRNSWGEKYEEVAAYVRGEDTDDDAPWSNETVVLFRGGGKEFVNERFKVLIAKCVPSPVTTKRSDQSYDEKGRPILKRQPPRNRKGEPLVDTKGRLVVAVRAKDRSGKGSPNPDKFSAWILVHTGEGYWASDRWLRMHGLLHELSWWGEVFDEESGKDRPKFKTVKEVLYFPCLLTQQELDELRAIMLVSTIAEEEGMIKAAALTVRKDGSVEFGIGGFGPMTSDKRDLYQEIHDSDSDDTRTRAKAAIEQTRTDTLPWMVADYDGPTSRRRDLDMFALGLHSGYLGVKPLPKPSREENKEMARLSYRLGQDMLCVGRVNGRRAVLRERNVLDLGDGTTFVPKDNPTRQRCVRKLEEFTRKNGSRGKYIRYGECIPSRHVMAYYSTGLAKRIDRSIKVELDGMIRGLIERGLFEFTLRRRKDEHAGTVVHKCHYKSCPHDEHAFNDKGHSHVCGASGQEYWMVKAMIELDPEYFPFLDVPADVDCFVVDIYGSLVGDLMRIAPDAFTKKTSGVEVMGHPSLNAMLV